jgi:hypothetical protein
MPLARLFETTLTLSITLADRHHTGEQDLERAVATIELR